MRKSAPAKTTNSLEVNAATAPMPPFPYLRWNQGMSTRSSPVLTAMLATFTPEKRRRGPWR